MSTPPAPSASNVRVSDVLQMLDGEFSAFASGVAAGRYSLWIGSGISLGRVNGLKTILLKAIERLQVRVDTSDPNCRFLVALRQLAALSGLSKERLDAIDLKQPSRTWDQDAKNDLLQGLAQNYAKVMQIHVQGESESDYLLWHIIDLKASYASGILEPDCEHLALAILGIEGVAPQIMSANWDGLVEKAFEELGHGAGLLVCACPDDLTKTFTSTRLIKFHGCAMRAASDESHYRPLLIHQAHQIITYHNNHAYKAIRNELISQATTRPTLMMGLSGQDADIQFVFAEAASAHARIFPTTPPAYICAEDNLGADQGTLLRIIYGESFDANAEDVERGSVVKAFAKPLLSALVLHVLFRKLQTIAKRCSPAFLSQSDLSAMTDDLMILRELVAAHADGNHLSWLRQLSQEVAGLMQVFRTGAVSGSSDYSPISSLNTDLLETDPDVGAGGLPEFALALTVVGNGVSDGLWEARHSPVAGTLALTSVSTGRDCALVFCGSQRSSVLLEQSGLSGVLGDNLVVVHSQSVTRPLPRSPRSSPGRTGKATPRHVGMLDLLAEARTADELRRRFREEASI